MERNVLLIFTLCSLVAGADKKIGQQLRGKLEGGGGERLLADDHIQQELQANLNPVMDAFSQGNVSTRVHETQFKVGEKIMRVSIKAPAHMNISTLVQRNGEDLPQVTAEPAGVSPVLETTVDTPTKCGKSAANQKKDSVEAGGPAAGNEAPEENPKSVSAQKKKPVVPITASISKAATAKPPSAAPDQKPQTAKPPTVASKDKDEAEKPLTTGPDKKSLPTTSSPDHESPTPKSSNGASHAKLPSITEKAAEPSSAASSSAKLSNGKPASASEAQAPASASENKAAVMPTNAAADDASSGDSDEQDAADASHHPSRRLLQRRGHF